MPINYRIQPRKRTFWVTCMTVTLLWTVWVAILVPAWQRRQAESQFAREVALCTNHFQPTSEVDEAAERGCMVRAQGMYVIRRTAFAHYWSIGQWPSLILVCLGLPALVFGLAAAVATLYRRLRPGSLLRNHIA